MRVLYVIDSLVPSGAERSLAAMAPHYADRGVRLEVAYLHDRPGLQDELDRAGAILHPLAGRGGRAAWVRRARRVMVERRPDLVHTTLAEADLVGRVAARLAGVPVVSSLVNVHYGPEQLGDPRLRAWKVRLGQAADAVTARTVVRFHAITAYVADRMSGALRIRRDRIDVIPRGRDPDDLGTRTPERRAAARNMLGVDDTTPVVLAVGRQERQKGIDVLLESFTMLLQEVPDARLFVAGREGNATPDLRAAMARLDLDDGVRFLGPRTDVLELLCAADVFVFPSRWEGLGSVLLEAMALEAPIVATDLPAVGEVVEEGSTAVALVPTERPDALAVGMVAALSDRHRAQTVAKAARERFLSHYTVDRVTDGMVAFYRRALEG